MNLKLAITLFALAATPGVSQGQQNAAPPDAHKPTMAEVQEVVQIISGDKTKTQHYCEMGKINEQIEAAEKKNDTTKLASLGKQADSLALKIGPEYMRLMDGLAMVDENSPEGRQFNATLESLDKLCGR
jgi:hypothetical protein